MTASREGFQASQIPDMERRLAGIVRIGTVHELDYRDKKKPRVRVKSGSVITGWIPWLASRAGRRRSWSPLKKGEQVLMACPSGDLAQAVIVGSIHYSDCEAPANGEGQTVDEWDDGAKISYDEESHTLTHDIPSGGTIVLKIGGTTLTMTQSGATLKSDAITLDGPVHATGDITCDGGIMAQGDVIGENVSLAHHRNTGVLAGPGISGEPLPEA